MPIHRPASARHRPTKNGNTGCACSAGVIQSRPGRLPTATVAPAGLVYDPKSPPRRISPEYGAVHRITSDPSATWGACCDPSNPPRSTMSLFPAGTNTPAPRRTPGVLPRFLKPQRPTIPVVLHQLNLPPRSPQR
jgi:hypothetical protein